MRRPAIEVKAGRNFGENVGEQAVRTEKYLSVNLTEQENLISKGIGLIFFIQNLKHKPCSEPK